MKRQTWQMFVESISEDIIKEIVDSIDKTEKAKMFNDDSGKSKFRSSRVSFINDIKVLNLLYDYVDVANKNAFGVSVFKEASIQYTEYHATENGHYDWHHDIDWNANDIVDRKLSVTVQLSNPSEYEGGDFMFREVPQLPSIDCKKKGTVLVFPSYLFHKVSPVTKGIRRSLVAWFEGPSWR